MLAVAFAAASAAAAPDRPASPPPTDYWQKLGFINMAHQGGERENPGNTMFAFKKALADGADAIDMDLTLTKDGHLIATHDAEPCHTSNGPCTAFKNLTLEQVRTYDFAYWFSPGLATYYDKNLDVPHPYRGMATGDVPPPAGYTAKDFQIATFDEILDAFPNTPINVELKPHAGIEATAEAAAEVLADHPGREKDVIVNAFSQAMIEAFHEAAPKHLALGGSEDATFGYVGGSPIEPTPVAVQPPDKIDLGDLGIMDTLPLLRQHFEYDGYIAVVWPSDKDEAQETDLWYQKLIDQGAGAINTMFPSRLHEYLCKAGVPAADGSLRCPGQQCPEGYTGFAPNCEEIPACPPGTEGTSPDCHPIVIADPAWKLTGLRIAPKKAKVKRGGKAKLKLSLRFTDGLAAPKKVKVFLKSSNRHVKVPRSVFVPARGKATGAFKVRATRKARGKATITAKAGRFKAVAKVTVKR